MTFKAKIKKNECFADTYFSFSKTILSHKPVLLLLFYIHSSTVTYLLK